MSAEAPTTVFKVGKYLPHDPNEVYVGRPSQWGNPFVIGTDGTRDEVMRVVTLRSAHLVAIAGHWSAR